MAIQKILCCCGSGLGSSLMVEMQIQDVLNELGVSGVEVEHSTVSDVTPGAADLFIVARDLEDFIAGIPEDEKIVLSNILDKDEMKEAYREVRSVSAVFARSALARGVPTRRTHAAHVAHLCATHPQAARNRS